MYSPYPGSVDPGSFPKDWGDKQVHTSQEQEFYLANTHPTSAPREALEAEEANDWVAGFTSHPGSRSQGRLGL